MDRAVVPCILNPSVSKAGQDNLLNIFRTVLKRFYGEINLSYPKNCFISCFSFYLKNNVMMGFEPRPLSVAAWLTESLQLQKMIKIRGSGQMVDLSNDQLVKLSNGQLVKWLSLESTRKSLQCFMWIKFLNKKFAHMSPLLWSQFNFSSDPNRDLINGTIDQNRSHWEVSKPFWRKCTF